MKALIEKEINHPLIQMIRTHLRNDDRLDPSSYDHQLEWLSEIFKRQFDTYLNEERTNHMQAREMALNDLVKNILK